MQPLGIAAGILGRFVDKEDVWGFTPFVDLSLYRWIRRNLRQPRIDRQFLMLFVIVVLEIGREWLSRMYPKSSLCAEQPFLEPAGCRLAMRAGSGRNCAESLERSAAGAETQSAGAPASGGASGRACNGRSIRTFYSTR